MYNYVCLNLYLQSKFFVLWLGSHKTVFTAKNAASVVVDSKAVILLLLSNSLLIVALNVNGVL